MALSIYHGCGTAPTTSVTLDLPEGLAVIRPRHKIGWTIDSERRDFAQSVEIHGEVYSSGIKKIIWKDGSTPAHLMDSFLFSAYVLDIPEGEIEFVVRQQCDGVEEVEESVQTIRVVARQPPPGAEDTGTTESADAPGDAAEQAEPSTPDPRDGTDWGLVLGGLACVLSIVSLWISLRRS